MRVITGKYKGRHFEPPKGFKARPTTDFAKENLFNVLNAYIDYEQEPSALDLFSGTGGISLELVSRGCGHVVSVEQNPLHHAFIASMFRKLNEKRVLPIRTDVFRFIDSCYETYDIIFADPPYALKNLKDIPGLIFEKKLLNPGGIFVLEHGKEYDFSGDSHYVEHRSYGSVNFTLFKNPDDLQEGSQQSDN